MDLQLSEGLKITGRIKFILENIITGEKRIYEQNNTIVTAGKVAIARRLGGVALLSNEGQVTYGATGTGTATVQLTDIKLQTELDRDVTVGIYSSNTVTISVFFSTTQSNGTITEFGLFGEEATAVADTGTLFNRVVLVSPIIKVNTETLTIECILTVS